LGLYSAVYAVVCGGAFLIYSIVCILPISFVVWLKADGYDHICTYPVPTVFYFHVGDVNFKRSLCQHKIIFWADENKLINGHEM